MKCVTCNITRVVICCLTVFCDSLNSWLSFVHMPTFYIVFYVFLYICGFEFTLSYFFHCICHQIFAKAQPFLWNYCQFWSQDGASLSELWKVRYYKSVSFWGHLSSFSSCLCLWLLFFCLSFFFSPFDSAFAVFKHTHRKTLRE